jgi:microfibrillar-associated protein 1
MTQEKAAAMAEEAIRKEEEMRETRKLDSKELAGETIRRELAESEPTLVPQC